MFDKEKWKRDLEKDKARLGDEKIEDALNEVNDQMTEDGNKDVRKTSAINDISEDDSGDSKLDEIIKNGEEKEEDDEESDKEWTLTPVIKLKVPVNGLDEIKLDFSDLNGKTLKKIERIWEKNRTSKKWTPLTAMDTEYCMFIAAHCSGIPYSRLEELNASDYSKVKMKVQNFLLGS